MDAGERAAPDGGVACAEARREIAAFVHASPDAARSRFLSAHLERCRPCAALYKETLERFARVGRGLREERVASDRDRRHRELVRLSRGAGRRPPRHGLKLFLVTCGLFFLLTQLARTGFGARLTAHDARGKVTAAGAPLAPGAEVALARGDVCATGPFASVALKGDGVELALEAESSLLVEEAGGPDGPRVRLRSGALAILGRGTVTTPLGVVAVERGRCRIEVGPESLSVACEDGAADVVGPLGRRAVAAGERATLEL